MELEEPEAAMCKPMVDPMHTIRRVVRGHVDIIAWANSGIVDS